MTAPLKRILITGVSGYIGSRLVDSLATDPQVEVIVGLDVHPPAVTPSKMAFIDRDVRRPILPIVDRYRIDTIFHGAYVLTPIHDTRQMEDINITGTRNVLSAAETGGISQLIYTSSTTAYGFHSDNPVPLVETDALRGNDDFTYSKNKRQIEALMADFAFRCPDITVTVLRPCFVIGPHLDNPLARYLLRPLVPVPIQRYPLQFVHEDDLVRAICLCLKQRIGGVYNIAGTGSMDLTDMIRQLGNRPMPLPFSWIYHINDLAWRLRLGALTEFPSPALNMMRYPWIASSRRFVDKTGFSFHYDTASAFSEFAGTHG